MRALSRGAAAVTLKRAICGRPGEAVNSIRVWLPLRASESNP